MESICELGDDTQLEPANSKPYFYLHTGRQKIQLFYIQVRFHTETNLDGLMTIPGPYSILPLPLTFSPRALRSLMAQGGKYFSQWVGSANLHEGEQRQQTPPNAAGETPNMNVSQGDRKTS